jgi:hypothetical protein
MSHTDSYLTLCIEERDENNYGSVKTRLFVSYDIEQESYVVYGKSHRMAVDNTPYFFRADKASDMYKFVRFVVGDDINNSFTLYNYNNMPFDLEGVDYEFMESNMDLRYEIVVYDNVKITKKSFKQNLRMLKTVYNFY